MIGGCSVVTVIITDIFPCCCVIGIKIGRKFFGYGTDWGVVPGGVVIWVVSGGEVFRG